MKTFTFFWSPEGRPIATIGATTKARARAIFKREYRHYARYMGEVYIVEE